MGIPNKLLGCVIGHIVSMFNYFKEDDFKRKLLIFMSVLLFYGTAGAGKRQSYNLKEGDVFTVYTTYHYYLQSVLWNFDYSIVQPQHNIFATTTQVTFKVISSAVSKSVIQATSYYYENNSTSSGINKDLDSFTIYIQKAPDDVSISLNPLNTTLQVNGQANIYANITGGTYTGSYQWYNSNPNVVSMYDNGNSIRVIGVASGSSTIKCTLDNGKSATCNVTVCSVEPTSVSIPSNLTIYVSEEETLSPSLQPSNAQTSYTWYSSDKTKAIVTNGRVKGVDEGSTQIYCRTSNGKQSNMCNVEVFYRKPTGIFVNPTNVSINLYETMQLSYSVNPSNAKTTVSWHSEDDKENFIKLSSSGLITPVSVGSARVYAETDNGCKGYCTIMVLPDPIKISIPAKFLLMFGDSATIAYKVEPPDAYANPIWTSDNPEIVKVDSKGKIEGVAGGIANIKAETHNGKSATCRIEVPEPDYRIYVWFNDGTSLSYPLCNHPKVTFPEDKVLLEGTGINAEFARTDFNYFTISDDIVCPFPTSIDIPSSLQLVYGDNYQIPYTLRPQDYGFNATLQWSSTDNHVAIVSNNGHVQAVGGGETDIIVEASNGCQGICHVTVPVPEFYLVIWLQDGRKSIIHLREKPNLCYEADGFSLISEYTETHFNAADIRKITLTDNPDREECGVIRISAEELQEHISMSNSESIVISGGCPGAVTSIYLMSGLLVGTFKADENGVTCIPISHFSPGVLIIKSGTIIFKILKK